MPPDKVRFVGELVAIVVAESIYQAKDAAERLCTVARGGSSGGRGKAGRSPTVGRGVG